MKKFLPYIKYFAVFLFGIVILCTTNELLDELLSAPEKIEIDGREFILETYLVRDFFPPCPPGGRPLAAVITVIAIDSLQFPYSLDADYLWIIKDDEVWGTELIDYEGSSSAYELKKLSKDEGPKWGPKIYVDAVVRVVDDEDNNYLLRAADQWIHRTE